MQRILLGVLVAGIALSGPCVSVHGEEQALAGPAADRCAPNCPVTREVIYQDVIKHVCRKIPEVKKRWMYSWVDQPFCVPDFHKGGCPGCAGPYYRKVLLKRLVEEPCGEKCVVETMVEKVPVVVCRPSPCGGVSMPAGAPPTVVIPPLPRPIPQMPPANGEVQPKVPQMPPANSTHKPPMPSTSMELGLPVSTLLPEGTQFFAPAGVNIPARKTVSLGSER